MASPLYAVAEPAFIPPLKRKYILVDDDNEDEVRELGRVQALPSMSIPSLQSLAVIYHAGFFTRQR